MMSYEEQPQIKRTQPRLVTFVQAVIAFKRLARRMKRWRHLDDRHSRRSCTQPSALLQEVRRSDVDIKRAAGGHHIIHVTAEDISETRKEMKTNRILVKRERKRAEDEARHQEELQKNLTGKVTNDDVQAALIISTKRRNREEFASHLNQKQRQLDAALFNKLDAHAVLDDVNMDVAVVSDVAALLQKNQTLGRHDEGKSKIKKDEKEKIEYLPGTTIYYGSTVALQGRHGGYMSYANQNHVKASAHKVLPYARFVVINCDDPSDSGLLRYGDAIWLQAGLHEVLGAQYVNRPNDHHRGPRARAVDKTKEREIVPALVNSRKENAFKAHQYGRWIVLNRDRPLETLGEYVTHLDKCMFEQGWYFMASHSPYDSLMVRKGSFEEMAEGNIDAFQPGTEACWSMHLVALPMDEMGGGRRQKQGAEVKAFEQIEKNKEFRFEKGEVLRSGLEQNMPTKLSMERLMVDQLGHKLTPHDTQHGYLKKYLEQSENHFSQGKHALSVLSKIYGPDSFVVHLARRREIIHEHELGNMKIEKEMEKHLHDRHLARKPIKEALLDDYWDKAARVMLDTRAWAKLSTAMDPYYERDMLRKFRAARVIGRFLRKVRKAKMGFPTMMMEQDKKTQSKLVEDGTELREMLYRKNAMGTRPADIDDAVQEQWDEITLKHMDSDRASRLRDLCNAMKSQKLALERDKANQKAAKELHERRRRQQQEMEERVAKIRAGGSLVSSQSRAKRAAEEAASHDVRKTREELSFRGYEVSFRPGTTPGPPRGSHAMTKVTAMPIPKYMCVYTEEPLAGAGAGAGEDQGNTPGWAMTALPPVGTMATHEGVYDERGFVRRPGTAPAPSKRASSTLFGETLDSTDRLLQKLDPAYNRQRAGLSSRSGLGPETRGVKKLPQDVLSRRKPKVSLSTSVSFLKLASKTPGIYDDIVVKKRGSSTGGSSSRSHASRKSKSRIRR